MGVIESKTGRTTVRVGLDYIKNSRKCTRLNYEEFDSDNLTEVGRNSVICGEVPNHVIYIVR